MIRPAGDTIELTPPLIVSENEIGEIMDKVGASIKAALRAQRSGQSRSPTR